MSNGSLDHGHDICGTQAEENYAEGRSVSLRVLYRSPEVVLYTIDHTIL